MFSGLRVVPQIVFFLVTFKVSNVKHIFLNSNINTSSKNRVFMFLTLDLLLIQMLIIFLLFLNIFVKDFAIPGIQIVIQFHY